jgi:hypothetical protein
MMGRTDTAISSLKGSPVQDISDRTGTIEGNATETSWNTIASAILERFRSTTSSVLYVVQRFVAVSR